VRTEPFVFDELAATRAENFFRKLLTHVKGEWAGQEFQLSPWQAERVIRPMFGWKRADGSRRYRTCYVEIPRKNGKSTISSGVALYLLFSDGEPGAEIYSAAADRLQAAIVFDAAKSMVEASPKLRSKCKIYKREIVVEKTGSVYRVLSADAATKHGLNAHGIIFDELHAQANRELWDVLATSTGARRQPMTLAITTAGYDRHSICYEVHDYARKVADGVVTDDTFLPVVYAASAEDDWTLPATWKKANPSLGATIKLDYLDGECKRAREVPGYENTFKRLHLNIWTEQATRWLPMEAWDECGGVVDATTLAGRSCYAGFDLSTTTDLTALVLLFPPESEGEKFKVLPHFWIPGESLEKRVRRDHVPYDVWARDGLVEVTDGNVTDYDTIRHRIRELAETYRIQEIAYDRWNSSQIVTQLQEDGANMVPIGQGWQSMSAPSRELEKLVLGREFEHGGNPVLRWMAANVAIKTDPAGNIKPDKERSTERIDGIVALVMAISRASVADVSDAALSAHFAQNGVMVL